MGWYYTIGGDRRGVMDEIMAPSNYRKVLKRTLRGNVLWTVEEYKPDNGPSQKFIGCYLLQPHRDGWGYKPMNEAAHPYYYTCPLSWLAEVPEECHNWREGVRRYHERRKLRAKSRRV